MTDQWRATMRDRIDNLLTEWYRADPDVRALTVPALDALGDAILSLIGEVEEETRADEDEIRKRLWVNHGCPFHALYGDDGEMQCNAAGCMLDFKREPLPRLLSLLIAAGRLHAGKLPPPDPASAERQPNPALERIGHCVKCRTVEWWNQYTICTRCKARLSFADVETVERVTGKKRPPNGWPEGRITVRAGERQS